jgi:hypothetical protein
MFIFLKCLYFTLFITLLVSGTAQPASLIKKRVNIFIYDNPPKKNIFSQTVWWRARWHSFFSKGKMVAFRGKTPEATAQFIEKYISKHNVIPGLIWFDSHGYYYNRQATFYIGQSMINHVTINDPYLQIQLKRIAACCDGKTRIALGACFSAATFYFPDKDTLPGRKMNGDSLLLALGNIFTQNTIYGCQSWVMENPGIWHNKYRLAGVPSLKKYKDEIFKPAWEKIGIWSKYNPLDSRIEACNTIALDNSGFLFEKSNNFQHFHWVQSKKKKNLKHLKPNLYKHPLKLNVT